jgi:hypothetical protein
MFLGEAPRNVRERRRVGAEKIACFLVLADGSWRVAIASVMQRATSVRIE